MFFRTALISLFLQFLYSCLLVSEESSVTATRFFQKNNSWSTTTCEQICQQDSFFASFASDIATAFSKIQHTETINGIVPGISVSKKYIISDQVSLDYIHSIRSWIVSFPEQQSFLGQGRHKKVTKVILVKKMKAYIAAHCKGDISTKREVSALQAVKDMQGIVPFFGAVPLKKGKFYSIFLLYCSMGELRSYVVKKAKERLSFHEKMIVARDAALGLYSLHKKGLIHFDIHAGNVFIDRDQNGNIRGYLGDFGHTFSVSYPGKRSGYVAARRVPPESLRINLSRINRYKTDIHALGAVFYEIAWHTYHPWGFILSKASCHELSSSVRQMYYRKIVTAFTEMKKNLVGTSIARQVVNSQLTPEERFKILTFDMMHYLPEKRPSLPKIIKELNTILKQIEDQQ